MDHLVIPLGRDHVRALRELVDGAAAASGVAGIAGVASPHPHITLIAHLPGQAAAVRAVVDEVTRATTPFTVHAHGYGFFTGDGPSDLSLHVPVVRTPALDALHAELWAGLRDAGVEVAGWTDPDLWSPHITLLDRGLSPSGLGAAVAWLARRHHPSWQVPVDGVAMTGGRSEPDRSGEVVALGRGGG